MDKQELRRHMRRLRREMTADEVKEKSALIHERLYALPEFTAAKTVMLYLSAFNEVSTEEIIERLWESGKRAVVPLTDPVTFELTPVYLERDTALKSTKLGVSEPIGAEVAKESDIDLILVPGVAFDEGGGRLGFGKGCYDRLLENATVPKIALCYELQIVERVPADEHDVVMDALITERRIIRL